MHRVLRAGRAAPRAPPQPAAHVRGEGARLVPGSDGGARRGGGRADPVGASGAAGSRPAGAGPAAGAGAPDPVRAARREAHPAAPRDGVRRCSRRGVRGGDVARRAGAHGERSGLPGRDDLVPLVGEPGRLHRRSGRHAREPAAARDDEPGGAAALRSVRGRARAAPRGAHVPAARRALRRRAHARDPRQARGPAALLDAGRPPRDDVRVRRPGRPAAPADAPPDALRLGEAGVRGQRARLLVRRDGARAAWATRSRPTSTTTSAPSSSPRSSSTVGLDGAASGPKPKSVSMGPRAAPNPSARRAPLRGEPLSPSRPPAPRRPQARFTRRAARGTLRPWASSTEWARSSRAT